MFRHILVPTDGSDLSRKAIDGAIDLAQAVGARVTAYACLPQYPYSPFSDVVIEPPVEFLQRSEREARASAESEINVLKELLDTASAESSSLTVELAALKQERVQVKNRVDAMLKQLDDIV